MDRETLVYEHFIKPFVNKTDRKVGMELEFPIQTAQGSPSMETLLKILPELCAYGFEICYHSADNHPIWTKNREGTYLSFDTSYLNFEFSLCPTETLDEMAHKFEDCCSIVSKVMKTYDCYICGQAINDQAIRSGESFRIQRGADEICQMEYEYLKKYGTDDVFTHQAHPNFFTLISSIQTHFDTDEKQLVRVLNVLSRLDFIEILLFANSPWKIGSRQLLDIRYYLYRNSAFARLSLTGCNEMEYHSIEELVRDYATRKIPWPGDMLYSYRNEELTRFGTIEYRVVDEQPLKEVMVPAAFNYGLIRRLAETEDVLAHIYRDIYPQYTKNELTDRAMYEDTDGFFAGRALKDHIWQLYDIAERGLYASEKELLYPLKSRIDEYLSPAGQQLCINRTNGTA